jgi:endoglucanase
VKEVVDYVIGNGLYAILNDHWDGGWLELNPFYKSQDSVSKKERAIWTQIATYFKDYDEHLLFAGMNEVNKGSGDPAAEHLTVHQYYIQTFVDAVRGTGGNNLNRTLVIQSFCTNIKYAVDYLKIPNDVSAKKLMVEVHFYDPWEFCGEGGNVYLWGKNFLGNEHASNWGQEDWVEQAFGMMKTAFVNKGYPVVIGEFSVTYRKALPAAELAKHIQARNYYYNFVAKTAIADGIVPCVWDNGEITDKGCGLFDRTTNTMYYSDTIAALISAGKK